MFSFLYVFWPNFQEQMLFPGPLTKLLPNLPLLRGPQSLLGVTFWVGTAFLLTSTLKF